MPRNALHREAVDKLSFAGIDLLVHIFKHIAAARRVKAGISLERVLPAAVERDNDIPDVCFVLRSYYHKVALVYARSGLSIKHGLCMANGVGVVDSDYRGELKVPMVNLGAEAYTIQPGERVAQLCIAPVYTAAFVPAEELGDTQRGVGGFGSTGK